MTAAAATAAPLPPANEERRVQSRESAMLSAADRQAYRRAFDAARDREWDALDRILGGIRDDRLFPVLQWLRIRREGVEDRDAIRAFLDAHPEFPSLDAVRVELERLVAREAGVSEALTHFERHPPVTGEGVVRHALLLDGQGARLPAIRVAKHAWHDHDLDKSLEADLLAAFGDAFTTEDHWKRLDRLVWNGQSSAAGRMEPLVPSDYWLLADARLSLRFARSRAEAAHDRVPPSLKDNPGLVYERVRYLRRHDRNAEAQDILSKAGPMPGIDSRWWVERRIQIRNLIQDGDFESAYRIARDHGIDEGINFARLEFEAGWLALRFVGRPEAALAHFRTLYDGVGTPISRARGAYWTAMAHHELGNAREAQELLELAAIHPNTYYGQLAALRLGRADLALPPPEPVAEARVRAFAERPLAVMARLLMEVDQNALARTLLSHAVETAETPKDYAAAARFADDTGMTDMQVLLGKIGLAAGADVMQTAYPVHAALRDNPFVDPALAHAIARQESTFNVEAVSPVGARGLMQLMPDTAREKAGDIALAYTPARLTRDAAYNVALGSSYLRELIDRFDGYLPMAIAAYNAGPSRVNQWIEENGDPRSGAVHPVDWVEMIPFYETRNYVQRVLEGLQVYRVRLARGRSAPNRLDEDLGLRPAAVCLAASARGAC
ncbi:MAG: hypothetical protein TEF_00880 [Rhizobiales bacterium NRL2]|jgi:soluble lytic murein transglycosylase|nr:MAG: hypothetical protein TEF_00880 [Rhizobiales bacterium NRL2]